MASSTRAQGGDDQSLDKAEKKKRKKEKKERKEAKKAKKLKEKLTPEEINLLLSMAAKERVTPEDVDNILNKGAKSEIDDKSNEKKKSKKRDVAQQIDDDNKPSTKQLSKPTTQQHAPRAQANPKVKLNEAKIKAKNVSAASHSVPKAPPKNKPSQKTGEHFRFTTHENQRPIDQKQPPTPQNHTKNSALQNPNHLRFPAGENQNPTSRKATPISQAPSNEKPGRNKNTHRPAKNKSASGESKFGCSPFSLQSKSSQKRKGEPTDYLAKRQKRHQDSESIPHKNATFFVYVRNKSASTTLTQFKDFLNTSLASSSDDPVVLSCKNIWKGSVGATEVECRDEQSTKALMLLDSKRMSPRSDVLRFFRTERDAFSYSKNNQDTNQDKSNTEPLGNRLTIMGIVPGVNQNDFVEFLLSKARHVGLISQADRPIIRVHIYAPRGGTSNAAVEFHSNVDADKFLNIDQVPYEGIKLSIRRPRKWKGNQNEVHDTWDSLLFKLGMQHQQQVSHQQQRDNLVAQLQLLDHHTPYRGDPSSNNASQNQYLATNPSLRHVNPGALSMVQPNNTALYASQPMQNMNTHSEDSYHDRLRREQHYHDSHSAPQQLLPPPPQHPQWIQREDSSTLQTAPQSLLFERQPKATPELSDPAPIPMEESKSESRQASSDDCMAQNRLTPSALTLISDQVDKECAPPTTLIPDKITSSCDEPVLEAKEFPSQQATASVQKEEDEVKHVDDVYVLGNIASNENNAVSSKSSEGNDGKNLDSNQSRSDESSVGSTNQTEIQKARGLLQSAVDSNDHDDDDSGPTKVSTERQDNAGEQDSQRRGKRNVQVLEASHAQVKEDFSRVSMTLAGLVQKQLEVSEQLDQERSKRVEAEKKLGDERSKRIKVESQLADEIGFRKELELEMVRLREELQKKVMMKVEQS